MGVEEHILEAGLALANNKNVQDKAVNLVGMLWPYLNLNQEALNLYVDDIKNSNMSTESKMYCLLTAEKTLKRVKNQGTIANIARIIQKMALIFLTTLR